MLWGGKKTLEDSIRKCISAGDLRKRQCYWYQLTDKDRSRLLMEEQNFFDLFSWLPIAIEHHSDLLWTVDATPETYLKRNSALVFGRRFYVFYSNVLMGSIDVSPHYLQTGFNAYIDIELSHLEYIPYHDVLSFLTATISLSNADTEHSSSDPTLNNLLVQYLWDTLRIDKMRGCLKRRTLFKYSLSSNFKTFTNAVDHWIRSGRTIEQLHAIRHKNSASR